MRTRFLIILHTVRSYYHRFQWRMLSLVKNRYHWPRSSPVWSHELFLSIPENIKPSDPTIATGIKKGIYSLEGYTVETQKSPFLIESAPKHWQQALHDFSWLVHFHGATNKEDEKHIRNLVVDWLKYSSKSNSFPGNNENTAARRIINWCIHAPLFMTSHSSSFNRSLIQSMLSQSQHLIKAYNNCYDDYRRLEITIALVYLSLALDKEGTQFSLAQRLLVQELKKQISAQSGLSSRNLDHSAQLFSYLYPLKNSAAIRHFQLSPSIDETLSILKEIFIFARSLNNQWPTFHGSGNTRIENILQLTNIMHKACTPPLNGNKLHKINGFVKIKQEETEIYCDTTAMPTDQENPKSGKSLGAFELISKTTPIVINCGYPQHDLLDKPASYYKHAAFSSTAIFHESLSKALLFNETTHYAQMDIEQNLECKTTNLDKDPRLSLEFDCGNKIRQKRSITLNDDGTIITGHDSFQKHKGKQAEYTTIIRFHLHPSLSLSHEEHSASIILKTRDQQAWRFSSNSSEQSIDKSVYFSGPYTKRHCHQIVLTTEVSPDEPVIWTFEKLRISLSK